MPAHYGQSTSDTRTTYCIALVLKNLVGTLKQVSGRRQRPDLHLMEQERPNPFDLFLVAALFGLLVYLFFPTLKEIALICWTDDDYSHGTLLPFVSLYMLWDQRDVLKNAVKNGGTTSIARGELLLVSGLAAFFVGQVSGISFASWVAFFPTIIAAVYLSCGRDLAWTTAWPVLLLFMAKPLPDSLVVRLFWPLQVLAAKASYGVLDLLGVPVYMMGNIIEIPQMKLLVEEACSGMRSVMALLTLSLVVIYFLPLRLFFKFALVAASILVAVVLNIFRVGLTGILAHFYSPSAATGFFHTFSGLVVFIVGLPVLYGIGVLLLKLDRHLQRRKS